MGDTGVSDIASHVEICATLVCNDFEESGASRSWSTEDQNHLTRSQNARVPRRGIRSQQRCPNRQAYLWMILRTGGGCSSLFGKIGWSTLRRTTKGNVTSSVTASIQKVRKNRCESRQKKKLTGVCRHIDLLNARNKTGSTEEIP